MITVNNEKKQKLEEASQVADAISYLKETDYYYARLAETGDAVPAEVVEKRKAARELIREKV